MKYIITTVQRGALVNKNLLQNLRKFAEVHNVDKILTFVQNGRYKDEEHIDKRLVDIEQVDKLTLNSNLRLQDMKILAQQINPFTGLNMKLSRDFSYILPSAKIRYESIPSTSKVPRAFMTTGALTHGNYKEHTAQGRKAQAQHQYGFVFVEVRNRTIFNAYQVEATKRGDFHYLDEYYRDGKQSYKQPEVIVLGDWHLGDTNPTVRKKSIKMIEDLKPKVVVFHDIFNGHSINHHEDGHLISGIKRHKRKRDSLQKELRELYREINFFSTKFPKIKFVIVESNHDQFLFKYLDEAMFIGQPENFQMSAQIINKLIGSNRPCLEIALGLIGDLPENFKFLIEDEKYRVRGIELGQHGHRGVSGSRGTPSQFNRFNLRTITGHTHAPQLLANCMVVGTSTHLKLDYTKGASKWNNAHGIVYDDGKYALLTLF